MRVFQLFRTRWRDLWLNVIAASALLPGAVRVAIYRLYGMQLRTTAISPRCFFGGNQVQIAEGSSVNYGCFFDNNGPISIGKDCAIAMEVMFCTSTHEVGGTERRAGAVRGFAIRVEDGCWIGARALILPGVTVGKGCIIAAGAVVTKNCEPNGLYAGVPAVRIRELSQ